MNRHRYIRYAQALRFRAVILFKTVVSGTSRWWAYDTQKQILLEVFSHTGAYTNSYEEQVFEAAGGGAFTYAASGSLQNVEQAPNSYVSGGGFDINSSTNPLNSYLYHNRMRIRVSATASASATLTSARYPFGNSVGSAIALSPSVLVASVNVTADSRFSDRPTSETDSATNSQDYLQNFLSSYWSGGASDQSSPNVGGSQSMTYDLSGSATLASLSDDNSSAGMINYSYDTGKTYIYLTYDPSTPGRPEPDPDNSIFELTFPTDSGLFQGFGSYFGMTYRYIELDSAFAISSTNSETITLADAFDQGNRRLTFNSDDWRLPSYSVNRFRYVYGSSLWAMSSVNQSVQYYIDNLPGEKINFANSRFSNVEPDNQTVYTAIAGVVSTVGQLNGPKRIFNQANTEVGTLSIALTDDQITQLGGASQAIEQNSLAIVPYRA